MDVCRKLVLRKIHPEVLGRWCKRNSLKLVVREESKKFVDSKKSGKKDNKKSGKKDSKPDVDKDKEGIVSDDACVYVK